jgi:hypothetical protein
MSLTSHLENKASPIGLFLKQHFSQTSALTKDANRQLKDARTLRPLETGGAAHPYGTLGAAFDYRVRYAFAITPYHDLVAWHGAMLLSNPGGYYSRRLVKAFFEDLDATLHTLEQVGRRLAAEEEQILDRYCYVLSLFEQVFRSNAYVQGPLVQPTVKQSVEELLAIPQDGWLDDLGAMFTLFYDRYAHLLSRPAILNPIFAGSFDIGGADADMIVDGCLIDLKATISPQLKAEFLYQLAGYVLLDYHDAYHLTSVGIYMARQGILFSWPLAAFLQKVAGADLSALASLRQAFRILCQSEGANY